MSLEKKITRLVLGIFFAVVLVISFSAFGIIEIKVRNDIGKRLSDTAFVIAANPIIQTELAMKADPYNLKIQNYAERMRLKTNLLFISIIDMNGVRYSHPIPENIGRKFIGGDERLVLDTGESYSTEGEGHLGKSIRSFVPVYKDGVQVGAVVVGILKRDLNKEIRNYVTSLLPVFIMSLIVIVYLSKKLAKNIKADIYGLEPEEIAIQLREKESIINNMEEGLISVDSLCNITVINKKALTILKIRKEDQLDDKIKQLLKDVMYRRSRLFNKEIRLSDDIIVMANFYCIFGQNGKVVGAIASLGDYTKVHKLAEELTGVKELTWNLRAQNHEFMNKLHTISGLIQLEETDKALEYIFETTEKRGLITDNISKIKEPSIQGLLFSKYNRADEMRIRFEIDKNSNLKKIPNNIETQELLTIIGNLLENSIEELKGSSDGYIHCGIYQDDKIRIIVKNNGKKISEELKDNIFKRGYSTKGEYRGMGLYNIKSIIDNLGGELTLNSDEETTWEVII